jgi:hypothetical protein
LRSHRRGRAALTEKEGKDAYSSVDAPVNLLAVDLDLSTASVQISTDQGKTFNAGTQTAPEDDRPWVTAAGQNVYVAYHDFTAEAPVVCTSHDGGNTFVSCIQAFGANPSVTNCAENTVPARALAIDPTNSSLNFLYSCSTATENLQHPPFGPLHDYYLARSTDGGLTWTTHRVFAADTSGGKAPNYANIFGTLAIDSAGNYYALFAGTADDNNADTNPYHVYLESPPITARRGASRFKSITMPTAPVRMCSRTWLSHRPATSTSSGTGRPRRASPTASAGRW